MKKNYYLTIRLNDIELERLKQIQKLTQQKKSEIVREALYLLVLNRYSQFL
jgi:predicted DNA-binding protein